MQASDDTRRAATLLQGVATRLLRLARSSHAKNGIGSAQYSALAVLHDRGSMSLGELARAERVSHPTMSRVVAGLEKVQAVRRVEGPDKRSRPIELTQSGAKLYEEICHKRVAVLAAVLAQLQPATVEELIAVTSRVAAQIEAKPPSD